MKRRYRVQALRRRADTVRLARASATAAIEAADTAIASLYTPMHPSLFTFNASRHLHHSVNDALTVGTAAALRALARKVRAGTTSVARDDGPQQPGSDGGAESPVYAVTLFSDEFVSHMREEVAAAMASGVDFTRPNSMNNYGLVLRVRLSACAHVVGFFPVLASSVPLRAR